MRVLIALVTFVLSLGALFLLLWPLGARPSFAMLFLPMAIVLLAAFTLGLGLIVATLNTFYRDCGHLIAVVLQAWYFATPILFPIEAVRNPRSGGFGSIRRFISSRSFTTSCIRGRWPRMGLVATAAVIAATSLGIGYAIFKSQEDKMVFRL